MSGVALERDFQEARDQVSACALPQRPVYQRGAEQVSRARAGHCGENVQEQSLGQYPLPHPLIKRSQKKMEGQERLEETTRKIILNPFITKATRNSTHHFPCAS
jgi:hypothetical protein